MADLRVGLTFRACAVFSLFMLAGCGGPQPVERVTSPAVGGSVVPVEMVHSLPVVEVVMQDRHWRLIVDLGGTDALSLSTSALRDLQVHFTGRHRHIFDAFGKLWRGREFVVAEIMLADLKLYGVRGYEIPDNRFNIPSNRGAEDVQLDGYIGVDLLRQFNLLVDYPNNRLVLADHAAQPPVMIDNWASSKFDNYAGVTSYITLDGQRRRANWDTGASHTVIRPGRTGASWARWTYGDYEAVTSPSLSIGGSDLGEFDLVLLDFRKPRVDVILGTNLFESRAVWFDFVQQEVAVEPRSTD